jgi:hypothetical protein
MSASPISEYQILEALRQAPTERWPEVLAFVQHLQSRPSQESERKRWTAAELLKLPLAQREAILSEQAAHADIDYRTDPELTAFDAYGEDDLHVDSADTQAR